MEKLRRKEGYRQSEAESPGRPVSTLEAQEPQASEAVEPNSVQVISGANVLSLRLAGMPVAEARNLVGMIQHVDPDSPVLVNGILVRPDYRLAAGDTLEFVHHAGEKGAGYGPPD